MLKEQLVEGRSKARRGCRWKRTRRPPVPAPRPSSGSLATHTPNLRSAGLIDVDHDRASTLALSDLEIVLEMLEGICEKFHYFMRRPQIDRDENYFADELNLLFSYLSMGLNFKYQRR
ncbi:MAG: hypothetical protein LC803_22300 [Acidobacteria bacterium]|nr:hypothetical protein [Acidobacteriota bacterium]